MVGRILPRLPVLRNVAQKKALRGVFRRAFAYEKKPT